MLQYSRFFPNRKPKKEFNRLAKKKKEKKKRKIPAVPKSLQETAELIGRVGELQRQIRAVDDEVSEAVDVLKRDGMARVSPLQIERDECIAAVWAYAEGNKDDVTDGNKRRSMEVPTGTFGWRTNPPAVRILDGKKVLKELERLGLQQFIRTAPEPNKQAMLDDPEVASSVKGVKIVQDETFFVKPSTTNVEIEEPLSSLKAEWEE